MYQVILFDAYGTLFDEGHESVPQIAAEIAADVEDNVVAEEFYREWSSIYHEMEARVIDGDAHFQTIRQINVKSLSRVFENYEIDRSPDPYVDLLYQRWSNPPLFEDVRDTWSRLSTRIPHCGIVSNTDNETLHSALETTSLNPDYVLTSEDVRSYKPNPRALQRAYRDLGADPEEVVYVGNSSEDIEAAARAGVDSIWIDRNDEEPFEPTPTATIDSLEEFEGLI